MVRKAGKIALGLITALATATWPGLVMAGFVEIGPNDVLAIGTSYDDPRIIWSSVVRIGFGILIFFLGIKLLTDAYALRNTGNSDTQSEMIDTLWATGKTMVAAIVGLVGAPYLITAFFNLLGNYSLSINFG